MKLALLGATPAALEFARELRRAGHSIAAVFDAAEQADLVRNAIPSAELSLAWERALDPEAFEGVVVAGPLVAAEIEGELRLRREEQLRKLFQSRIPLLVMMPVCESIVGFELEMIRRDVKGIAVPLLPETFAPIHMRAAQCVKEGAEETIGKIELVQFERFFRDRSRSEILQRFAHDCDLARRMLGSIRRVTATGITTEGNEKPSLTGVAVNLDGFEPPPIRWTALPAGEFQGLRTTLIGSGGTIRFEIPETIDVPAREIGPSGSVIEYARGDGIAETIAYFERLVASQQRNEPSLPIEERFSSWNDACRAVEALEAIDRSSARRRSIELFNEEHSEESSFRGVMAASGCLLLLLGLAVYFGVGLFSATLGYRGLNRETWRVFQVCFLAPFVVFLLLQLLAFGLKRHRREKQRSE